MTIPALTAYLPAAAETELEDWGPLPEATGPEMATAGVTVWEDGDASAGIWECAPGPSYWKLDTHEVVHIIAGHMTITPDDGTSFELKSGDTAVFPRGWSGKWDLHSTVRKVFTVF
ncbi:MAG: cupin domain-containing protein [Rhodococcus sp. (in: high G+C Gram-positive bacteria)]